MDIEADHQAARPEGQTAQLIPASAVGNRALAQPLESPDAPSAAVAYLISLHSKRSRQTMRSFLNGVARIMGAADLHDCDWLALRRHHVQAVMEVLADEDKAPATINTYLAAIKGVVREAWMMKQIDTDTFQRIKQIKSVRGSRLPKGRALEPEEIRALFGVCDEENSVRGIRDAAMLAVLVGCGLRRSEIVALDFEHVIEHDQALRVLGKGNKERIAFMPDGTAKRLNQWITMVRSDDPGALFTRIRRYEDVTDNRMTDQAIYHVLDARREQAGIEAFAPHDLRRTFASTMLDNGEDIVTVKDAMGHSDVSTTQRYDRRGDERLKAASRRINVDM